MAGKQFLVALAALVAASPALAVPASECSARYREAKDAGTLGGLKWNEFRRERCGASQTSTTVRNPLDGGGTGLGNASPIAPVSPPTPSPPLRSGAAGFPGAVDPKYAFESPGKARMHTCLDSYRAAKASGGGAGMNWIEKGGGYYSACNRRLKGGA